MQPVDLRSDTVTKPTAGMRAAIAAAEVGDDVFGEDPTVNELHRRAASLLGKEAALFVPSGTMANLLAFVSQSRPGDTVILHADSHPFNYESGGLGMVAGVLTKTLPGAHGILEPERVRAAVVRNEDHHYSHTTLVGIENTTNRGGGAFYPLRIVEEIAAIARENGMRLHCDGARLFNAVVASGTSAAGYARHCDTVSFCFSKGLGAPAGSVLVGDRATIDRAHRYRKMLGGGMRQAGVLAAAALYALDHHIERLAEDHLRARRFRQALEGIPQIGFPLPSPTNIVFLEVPDALACVGHCADCGVFMLPVSSTRVRAVFHLDIDDAGVDRAIAAVRDAAIAIR
ncbi:MAG: aminotransferase class I/II-fold pyridoxal phosphate-dependent enzyme [Candidatus Hydrogenedentes bacterium]|nr:aminotransferase class I/II-fold pyridoxal phosphate-dependent enzyme [Candidatus Hydrogenedentota bacterium]